MKSAQEKLDRPAKIVAIPPRMRRRFGRGKMLIPAPSDMEKLIRRIPRGKVMKLGDLRDALARAAGATLACPLVTGIFLRVIAEASAEKVRAGKSRITPVWRVIHDDGTLQEKFPGGPLAQAGHLEAEGHTILRTGKLRVALG